MSGRRIGGVGVKDGGIRGNIVLNVCFIRHANSEANDTGNDNIRDAPLSNYGHQQVESKRTGLLSHGHISTHPRAIFCSPLRRSIETCLATYEHLEVCPVIYVMSLLMERHNDLSCEGQYMEAIQADTDGVYKKYRHFARLNFDYFWYCNACRPQWYAPEFRSEPDKRMEWFTWFLKQFVEHHQSKGWSTGDGKFGQNNVIHVHTHAGMINTFYRNIVDNYAAIVVPFNTGDIGKPGRFEGSFRSWTKVNP